MTRNLGPIGLLSALVLFLAAPLHGDEAALAEVERKITEWCGQHPDLVSVHSIGRSGEGRALRVLRISSTPSKGEGSKKPGVFFSAGIHGHEGSEGIALAMVEALLTKKKDARVRKLLAERVLWVQFVANPDGLLRSERKNAKGVDLNRNFGHRWGRDWGKEPIQARTNPGSKAFSEPETRAIRDFLRREGNVTLYVDCHRSARLILLPFGAKEPARVSKAYQALWKGLNRAMENFHRRPKHRRIRDFLPSGSGYAVDWAHAELGVGAFVWECPYGKIPKKDVRVYLKGVLHLLEKAGTWKRLQWF